MAAAAAFARAHPPGGAALTEEQKKEREELEARVKLLAELDEKYEDLGGCRPWRAFILWRTLYDLQLHSAHRSTGGCKIHWPVAGSVSACAQSRCASCGCCASRHVADVPRCCRPHG